ncbi:MAG: sigma-70 family RNA polymerase sigma factor [Lachnospiraceae bacterium]|nr:sigma-70 family RNA polymerase sigma factor [Lachnospiraceae bacterium]
MNGEQVVRTYSDMVYGVAMRYVRNRTDADDVYNDVFYRYFRRERTFSDEEHRKNWLLRVTINCAKDFLLNKTHHAELDDDMFGEVSITGSDISLEELMDLRNALKKLREEYREVIELYYLNGLNTREIALMLQKPEATIQSQMLRGREKLKELLS